MINFKDIKLVSTDLDGTLTDGSIYIDSQGKETRGYCVYDGQRIGEAKDMGVYFACITASKDPGIAIRMEKLGFDHCITGVKNKGPVLRELLLKNNINKENALHIGDDINDLEAFLEVGLKVAVFGGNQMLIDVSDYTTKVAGGKGTLREVIDIILK